MSVATSRHCVFNALSPADDFQTAGMLAQCVGDRLAPRNLNNGLAAVRRREMLADLPYLRISDGTRGAATPQLTRRCHSRRMRRRTCFSPVSDLSVMQRPCLAIGDPAVGLPEAEDKHLPGAKKPLDGLPRGLPTSEIQARGRGG